MTPPINDLIREDWMGLKAPISLSFSSARFDPPDRHGVKKTAHKKVGENLVTLSDSRAPAELEGNATFLIATNCDLMKSKCAKMLSERGYVSEVASDGFHALELLTTTDFTAVILDQTLRHFTGVNLTLLSRHVPRIQTTPFFIFCASKELDNVQNMISGIDGVFVMAKPVSRQKLDSILENLLLVRE